MRYLKFLAVILTLVWSNLQAQSLHGLPENAVIKAHMGKQPVKEKSKLGVLLTLPFFDDFSNSDVFPDPAKWTDRYVFINNSFARDPVSVGVATLDAIDEAGEVYTLTNKPESSDMLTSQAFDLSPYLNTGTVVRLSFFYQCGGNGETPEKNDSLLLEYYMPANNTWSKAWFANSDVPSAFIQQILEVPDSFFVQGFKFRFRNYTSISINDVSGGEGALSNADCWNVDYIMMNTNPLFSHQVINDIALTDVPRKMIDIYETIPWSHLNEVSPVIGRNNINYDIRNMLLAGDSTNIGRSYYIKDLNTGYRENNEIDYAEFPTDTLIHKSDPFFAPIVRLDDSKSGRIKVVSFLDTPANQYKENDTSKIILDFRDAYVLDDGTPEYGFGIEGPSMNGALLAIKFRIFVADTLQAVDMYFNKARNHFNENLKFRLCVWNDAGGKPGDLLYMSDEEYSPVFGSGTNTFHRYPIHSNDPVYITDSVVYVGWKQLTDEFLNIGYDVNRNNLNRTFVNTAGGWINPGGSLLPGTIMMRAVVGGKDVLTPVSEIPAELNTGLIIYPNPVKETLNFGPDDLEFTTLTIIDITGRTVYHDAVTSKHLDVSFLSAGIYQLILYTGKDKAPVVRKFVVNK